MMRRIGIYLSIYVSRWVLCVCLFLSTVVWIYIYRYCVYISFSVPLCGSIYIDIVCMSLSQYRCADLYLFRSLCVSLPFSLSLSHTHTHILFFFLFVSLFPSFPLSIHPFLNVSREIVCVCVCYTHHLCV